MTERQKWMGEVEKRIRRTRNRLAGTAVLEEWERESARTVELIMQQIERAFAIIRSQEREIDDLSLPCPFDHAD